MGGRGDGKAEFVVESEEEKESALHGASFPETSDDEEDEANEDLSLKIVEKAISMRTAKMASTLRDEGESVRDVAGSPSRREDVVAVLSKGKEEVESGEGSEPSLIALIDKEACEAVQTAEAVESVGPSSVEITDNAVMRKLLRGPRYFDPLGSRLGACYNCGGEGHMAINCTSEKRKKPCFICGSLEHCVKQCKKAQNCFICKKGSHRAKDCPEKQRGISLNGKMCLKCGESGHDMFFCTSTYPTDDLKVIQCYICQQFGHLCCLDPVDPDPAEVSCCRCGELGHAGLACGTAHERIAGEATPSSCFRCGEEGHFARECRNPSKARAVLTNGVSPSRCHRCGEEGHFARECRSSGQSDTRTPVISENFGKKGHFTHERRSTGAFSRSLCYKCNEEGHFAWECRSSGQSDTRTPVISENFGKKGHFTHERRSTGAFSLSLCYKCNEEGHFAWECRNSSKAHASSSNGPVNGVIASLCYKCGVGGHFARDCRKSNKTFAQTPAFCKRCGEVGHFANENKCLTKIMSPTLCYNCGDSGHFTKECRNLLKGLKREHELSTPSSKRRKDYREPECMPNVDMKSGKRKKTGKPNSRPTTLSKPRYRGGWITENPGDWSPGNSEKVRKSQWANDGMARGSSTSKSPGSGKFLRRSSRSQDTGNGWRRGNHTRW